MNVTKLRVRFVTDWALEEHVKKNLDAEASVQAQLQAVIVDDGHQALWKGNT